VPSDGAVRLSIDAEKQQDKTTYNKIFELPGFDYVFVIKQISAGSMTIYSKQRRSTGNQTIHNKEIITISVSNRTLNQPAILTAILHGNTTGCFVNQLKLSE